MKTAENCFGNCCENCRVSVNGQKVREHFRLISLVFHGGFRGGFHGGFHGGFNGSFHGSCRQWSALGWGGAVVNGSR